MNLAERVLSRTLERGRPRPAVVLIDGRSGAGKTSLGLALAHELAAQLVSMDELYPGWDGLAAGSRGVAAMIRTHQYLRYDWDAGRFGDSVALRPGVPLIIEGCGSVTATNRAAAHAWAGVPERTLAVWLETPTETRFERAMARDGEMFRPHWHRWAAQEDRHFMVEKPWALADEIIQSR